MYSVCTMLQIQTKIDQCYYVWRLSLWMISFVIITISIPESECTYSVCHCQGYHILQVHCLIVVGLIDHIDIVESKWRVPQIKVFVMRSSVYKLYPSWRYSMPSMEYSYRWSLYSEQKVKNNEKSNTELELFELIVSQLLDVRNTCILVYTKRKKQMHYYLTSYRLQASYRVCS